MCWSEVLSCDCCGHPIEGQKGRVDCLISSKSGGDCDNIMDVLIPSGKRQCTACNPLFDGLEELMIENAAIKKKMLASWMTGPKINWVNYERYQVTHRAGANRLDKTTDKEEACEALVEVFLNNLRDGSDETGIRFRMWNTLAAVIFTCQEPKKVTDKMQPILSERVAPWLQDRKPSPEHTKKVYQAISKIFPFPIHSLS